MCVCVYDAVYGALLGVQKGRSIEICNSFELLVNFVDAQAVLDKEYFTAKEEQCTCPCARLLASQQIMLDRAFSISMMPSGMKCEILIMKKS